MVRDLWHDRDRREMAGGASGDAADDSLHGRGSRRAWPHSESSEPSRARSRRWRSGAPTSREPRTSAGARCASLPAAPACRTRARSRRPRAGWSSSATATSSSSTSGALLRAPLGPGDPDGLPRQGVHRPPALRPLRRSRRPLGGRSHQQPPAPAPGLGTERLEARVRDEVRRREDAGDADLGRGVPPRQRQHQGQRIELDRIRLQGRQPGHLPRRTASPSGAFPRSTPSTARSASSSSGTASSSPTAATPTRTSGGSSTPRAPTSPSTSASCRPRCWWRSRSSPWRTP